VFKAGCFLAELTKFDPAMLSVCREALNAAQVDLDFVRVDKAIFSTCPADSIDYAVMEKTDKAAVIPVNMGWSDIGSWGALWEVANKDSQGNVIKGNVFQKDVTNCYIQSNKEIVATLGIDDLIIIETADALLIAHIDKEHEVKDVFKKLM
jgi:mannose-1-phosphate guanylyltransferase/mannose-1-phosphate guanylyltransferase/mannose-6-phosphate isomerase